MYFLSVYAWDDHLPQNACVGQSGSLFSPPTTRFPGAKLSCQTCWQVSLPMRHPSGNIFNVKLIFTLTSAFDLFHELFWSVGRRDTGLDKKGTWENEAFYKFLGKDIYYAKT